MTGSQTPACSFPNFPDCVVALTGTTASTIQVAYASFDIMDRPHSQLPPQPQAPTADLPNRPEAPDDVCLPTTSDSQPCAPESPAAHRLSPASESGAKNDYSPLAVAAVDQQDPSFSTRSDRLSDSPSAEAKATGQLASSSFLYTEGPVTGLLKQCGSADVMSSCLWWYSYLLLPKREITGRI